MRVVAAGGSWLFAVLASPCFAQTPPSTAILVSRNSGMCVDVYGNRLEAGTQIIQWRCHEKANKNWSFRPVTGGYAIVSRRSGMCLDVDGGVPDDGASIIQQPCNGQDNQRWTLKTTG